MGGAVPHGANRPRHHASAGGSAHLPEPRAAEEELGKANSDQKTKDAARDSYVAMEGEAKRRRAEIMGAAMD